jgi:hypothetical protein
MGASAVIVPGSDNRIAAHRHALNALEDFEALRRRTHGLDRGLINSISHHLRHAVYRTGKEVPWRKRRRYVRRHGR